MDRGTSVNACPIWRRLTDGKRKKNNNRKKETKKGKQLQTVFQFAGQEPSFVLVVLVLLELRIGRDSVNACPV